MNWVQSQPTPAENFLLFSLISLVLEAQPSGWVQLALGETDPKLRGKAIVGSVISLCFAVGALLGGVCTLHLPTCPLLPVVVLAAASTLLTRRERELTLNR